MNKCLAFLHMFNTEDNTYMWIPNVKYGVVYEDSANYYLRRVINHNELTPYPVSKSLEDILYKIKEKQHE